MFAPDVDTHERDVDTHVLDVDTHECVGVCDVLMY